MSNNSSWCYNQQDKGCYTQQGSGRRLIYITKLQPMRNQTSFRLTSTLLPTDLTATTTQVINKVDSNGDKFYPTFTEETVVLTNDDRTIMETTRATCSNWTLTFTKRGLSDDDTETQVANRKLTWNPWTLAFITAWAWDFLDKDDDIVWWWDQIYTWDMESRGKATYKGRLITEKWVEYPHFDSLEDLQAYSSPFGWMFAVVDSNWELYRYNAVTGQWDVITTNEPTNPELATEEVIWIARHATSWEISSKKEIWDDWAYLFISPKVLSESIYKRLFYDYWAGSSSSNTIRDAWESATLTFDNTDSDTSKFLVVEYRDIYWWWSCKTVFQIENAEYWYWPVKMDDSSIPICYTNVWGTNYYPIMEIDRKVVIVCPQFGRCKMTLTNDWSWSAPISISSNSIRITKVFKFS